MYHKPDFPLLDETSDEYEIRLAFRYKSFGASEAVREFQTLNSGNLHRWDGRSVGVYVGSIPRLQNFNSWKNMVP